MAENNDPVGSVASPVDPDVADYLAAIPFAVREYLIASGEYVRALLAEDEEFLRAKAAASSRTDETARRMARTKTKGEALLAESRMHAARHLMERR